MEYPKKILGSKEHVDWLDLNLNVAQIITVQDYKHKKTNVNGRKYIVLKLRVKQAIYESKI